MGKKSIKILFAILLASIMMFSIVATSSFATNTDTTDNNQKVVTKAKAATCKVTLNANGGKIGNKKTKVSKVKKGFKIGKQLVTPKRSGYTFNGWFTKKTGGKKITKTTKITKKVTYYAQWTKVRVLTDEEKKLVGKYFGGSFTSAWSSSWTDGFYSYTKYYDQSGYADELWFKPDGTYEGNSVFISDGKLKTCKITANWKISVKGTVVFSSYVEKWKYSDGTTSQWLQSQHPEWDPKKGYVFTEKDGKKGMNFNGNIFYEKVKN